MEYRGYQIKSADTIGYEIEYIGRGSSHMSLRGLFTDTNTAKKSIDRYLERKEEEDDEKLQRSRNKQIQRRINYRRKSVNGS